jgi:hypothetical protein
MEYKNGLMVLYMKAIGIIIKQKAKEHFGMLKVIFMSVISWRTRQMDLEFIRM